MLSSGAIMTTVEGLVLQTSPTARKRFCSHRILTVFLTNLETPKKVQDPVTSIFEANTSLVGSQYSK